MILKRRLAWAALSIVGGNNRRPFCVNCHLISVSSFWGLGSGPWAVKPPEYIRHFTLHSDPVPANKIYTTSVISKFLHWGETCNIDLQLYTRQTKTYRFLSSLFLTVWANWGAILKQTRRSVELTAFIRYVLYQKVIIFPSRRHQVVAVQGHLLSYTTGCVTVSTYQVVSFPVQIDTMVVTTGAPFWGADMNGFRAWGLSTYLGLGVKLVVMIMVFLSLERPHDQTCS